MGCYSANNFLMLKPSLSGSGVAQGVGAAGSRAQQSRVPPGFSPGYRLSLSLFLPLFLLLFLSLSFSLSLAPTRSLILSDYFPLSLALFLDLSRSRSLSLSRSLSVFRSLSRALCLPPPPSTHWATPPTPIPQFVRV